MIQRTHQDSENGHRRHFSNALRNPNPVTQPHTAKTLNHYRNKSGSEESASHVHVRNGFGSERDFCVIGEEDKIGNRAGTRVYISRGRLESLSQWPIHLALSRT
jgi:hypothetical protein